MFHKYVFDYLYPTDEREFTISEWVKEICEESKISDGVRINYLHETLVKDDPNRDVLKMAMMKVEMALVIDVTKPVREATYTLEGDGPL